MTAFKRYLRNYEEAFLREEINNTFPNLRKINYPRLQNGISFLEALTFSEKEEFVKNVTISDSENSLVRAFQEFTKVPLSPITKFKENKKLLKKIARNFDFLKFEYTGSDYIFSHYTIGRFRISSSVIAENRSCNVECRHTITHLERSDFCGSHSLMQMANLYHGDFWNFNNLDLDQTYEEVVSVLRKSYELLVEPLENFDVALIVPKPLPKYKNDQDWAKGVLGQLEDLAQLCKPESDNFYRHEIDALFKKISSGEMPMDTASEKILEELKKIIKVNPTSQP